MSKRKKIILRLVALVLLIAILAYVGTRPAVAAYFSLDVLRETIQGAGAWGVLGYVGAFTFGSVIQVPSLLFIVLAILIWEPLLGSLIALVGSLVATTFNYWMVRSIGGSPLADSDNRFIQWLLVQFDEHPFRTLILGRGILYMHPVINYPMALSGMHFGMYFLGSLIGFIIPIAVIALSLETVMEYFSWS